MGASLTLNVRLDAAGGFFDWPDANHGHGAMLERDLEPRWS